MRHDDAVRPLEQALAGTTDIDLPVSARRGRECEKALLGLGFKRFYAPPFGRYPGVDDWLGCDEGGALVHLQLHYRLVTRNRDCHGLNSFWRTPYGIRFRKFGFRGPSSNC